jgi:hypothetical protein
MNLGFFFVAFSWRKTETNRDILFENHDSLSSQRSLDIRGKGIQLCVAMA